MGRTRRDAPVTNVRGHLKELRNRSIAIAVIFGASSGLAYNFKDQILEILLAPLEGEQLSYLTVGGGFSFIFMLTIWCGIAVVLPFIAYSVYRFIAPAIPEKARTKAPIVFIASFALLVCGISFGYFIAIPNAIQFLLTFADEYVQAMLTADSYLSFILAYTVGLGILFQLPLILVIINWITPLKPKKLFSFERYVVVVSFILAAIVTPTPDIWNQTIIALPLIAMYQLGVCVVMWINWRESRKLKKAVSKQSKVAVSEKPAMPRNIAPQLAPLPLVTGQSRSIPAHRVMDIRPNQARTPTREHTLSRSSLIVSSNAHRNDSLRPQRSIDGMSTVRRAGT